MSPPKVSIRNLTESDLDLFFTWLNDPIAFGEWDRPLGISREEFMQRWKDGYYSTTRLICNDDIAIGWTRYFISDRKPWICGMGIFICIPEQRGKGLGGPALQLTMDEVSLAHPEVCKFELMTDYNNKPAQAVFEKLGFVKEGLLKRYWKLKGEFSDIYAYALLK